MEIFVAENPSQLGHQAGSIAASLIRDTTKKNGQANIILATGTSQFETLQRLVSEEIDWSRVVMFHLDEYIDLPETSGASFRKYLKERFIQKVPSLKAAYLISGETGPAEECMRLGEQIEKNPIDVALIGIGENGHLAFNDPPADFDTDKPFIIVELDDACRRQQMGEGWFNTFEQVPSRAISMSIKQIMKSKHIICSVPDQRKAVAVYNTLEKQVDNRYPSTILREHPDCRLFLDNESASLIKGQKISTTG